MADSAPPIGAPAERVVSSLRSILRPVVRFLLRTGITYPMLADVLKSLYVGVARDEFVIEGTRQTASRLSLLTGVYRKDIKNIANRDATGDTPPLNATLGAQLVARWAGDPAYLDEAGHPAPLPRLISEGGSRSFEGLVESVSKDIRSRVVLDEWLNLGVARLDPQRRVCLNVGAFVPERGFDEKLFFFGNNVHDHIAAALHNLAGNDVPFFERSVYYDGLVPESIEELTRLCSTLGMDLLQAVNRRAMELEQRDAGRSDTIRQRMNFGVYYFDASVVRKPQRTLRIASESVTSKEDA